MKTTNRTKHNTQPDMKKIVTLLCWTIIIIGGLTGGLTITHAMNTQKVQWVEINVSDAYSDC